MPRGNASLRDIDARISQRLRAARIERGLSQTELGALLGVSCQQAHKYEAAINNLSAAQLFTITAVFGVSMDAFCAGLVYTRPEPAATLPSKDIIAAVNAIKALPAPLAADIMALVRSIGRACGASASEAA